MDRGSLYFATVSCCLGISSLLGSCTYLEHSAKQSEYSRIQAQNPSQLNLKHMIDRQTFLVYGSILDASDSYSDLSFGVAAFSDRYKENELVGRRLIKLGDETFPQRVAGNVDIPLSQLDAADWAINIPIPPIVPSQAQLQAGGQFGFNTSHTGVLKDEDAIQRIVESIGRVRADEYPQSHIDALIAGGFDVDLDASYSDTEKYFIRTMGNYMALLANGTLDTMGDPILEHFALAAQGEVKAKTDPETAWLKFIKDYPHYVD